MAKTNYSYEKRQQELKKQKKRQEKLKKKLEKKNMKEEGNPDFETTEMINPVNDETQTADQEKTDI